MVENLTPVSARKHHQRPVVGSDIIEHDADRQHIVIGVRIEGPVLMPFDRRAAAGGLGVEFGGLQQHAVTKQLAQDVCYA